MSDMYPPPQPGSENPEHVQYNAGSQPFQPQQSSAANNYPTQPQYPQQPPMGYAGYPGGGAPTQPGYIKTNVPEYWRNARNGKRNLSILGGVIVALMLFSCVTNAANAGHSSSNDVVNAANQSSGQTTGAAHSTPAPTDTPAPTATPVPKESPAEYKASANHVSVADVAKDPNGYKGKTIKFTAVIADFVQDSNGNTGGANVDDPNDYSSVLQIEFTPSFPLSKVNKEDTIEVWGQGMGAFSGTNAYGGTITEGAVQEVYLVDTTTGFSDTSITDPASFASK